MKTFNVLYDKNANLEDLVNSLTSLGVTIQSTLSSSNLLIVTAEDSSFSSTAGILHAEEDVAIDVTPEYYWHQYRISSPSLPMIDSYIPAHDGAGRVVYVVDSGINSELSEFSNATIENLYSYNSTYSDELSHGTSIASVIVGNSLGVSKKAIVKNVKIPVGSTTISILLSAFDAVLTDHLLTPSDVKVVNCSWTVPRSYLLDLKISELQQNNLLVVAAAGNQGAAAVNYSPVGLNTVIGVAASDAYDRVISWGGSASSNWGPEVDITAPGIDVDVLMSDGSIGTISGTSIAAAVVSAVAVQYIQAEPTNTASGIQDNIIANAVVDLLFRNETIYGTTPNRIVYISELGAFILPEQTYKIKNGESATFNISVRKPFRGLEWNGIPATNSVDPDRFSSFWPFVTLNSETEHEDVYTYSVTVSPVEVATGRYYLGLKATSTIDNKQTFVNDMFFVYNNDITECDDIDKSGYVYAMNENDEVVVTLAAECGGSGGCGKGYFCYLTGGNCCGCFTNGSTGCPYESPPCTS
jgi:hypothetical protein